MYVDPFIFGIVCTIGVEILIALIVVGGLIYKMYKEEKEKEVEQDGRRR